ncbi:dTDP-4-dehydrorhamnose 3,5-epimerase [Clostridioides difficile]|uniref:dTDP-4-dehydrorhamnose 3,5-epimerase n=1 Tax=Clostridioides difficile TaxID=1496 RepID=UPI000309DC1B|nr:dTDP-4-dehydrorhamnose 3,5-epimerase [Clostridioides difficile]AXU48574.1 dTDP-4-dehydrorhamnose 3,5-epimerase [Clostridioides difficile]AXU73996.1 dTDP-4-dehydrorhamnose 3,5-epimerase [Clostridioides difficile]EGT2197548.1 dTDP-4-dehydrorhamnose 3,5-epimerase [Clostridioides difficile]EGT4048923.1 dTDP-4-dehydrorhamnose 3,5-epimerase [Clostridioides difficile]EGT4224943.1 dTDP-4-dehydrorhamnose 3,5-epimerase [Clostridioides difficile]
MYNIIKTKLKDCIEILPNVFEDSRGITIKPYHYPTFKKLGIEEFFNEDLFVTSKKGTIRGLHFQKEPFVQSKLVYCVSGSILDVAVDIRKDSPTYGEHVCFNIDSRKRNIAYIPNGFAHGYQALEENTIVIYKLSSPYSPSNEGGIKWDSMDINWNKINPIVSNKDEELPTFAEYIALSD